MLTKRPLWQTVLIGIFYGLIFAITLSVVEVYTDKNYEFSLPKAIFYFIGFTLFHTFSNRWKVNKTQ